MALDDLTTLGLVHATIHTTPTRKALDRRLEPGEVVHWYVRQHFKAEEEAWRSVRNTGLGLLGLGLVLLFVQLAVAPLSFTTLTMALVYTVMWIFGAAIKQWTPLWWKRSHDEELHFYGLTDRALMHIYDYRAKRYPLQQIQNIHYTLPEGYPKRNRHEVSFSFDYHTPGQAPQTITWKGIPHVESFLDTLSQTKHRQALANEM